MRASGRTRDANVAQLIASIERDVQQGLVSDDHREELQAALVRS